MNYTIVNASASATDTSAQKHKPSRGGNQRKGSDLCHRLLRRGFATVLLWVSATLYQDMCVGGICDVLCAWVRACECESECLCMWGWVCLFARVCVCVFVLRSCCSCCCFDDAKYDKSTISTEFIFIRHLSLCARFYVFCYWLWLRSHGHDVCMLCTDFIRTKKSGWINRLQRWKLPRSLPIVIQLASNNCKTTYANDHTHTLTSLVVSQYTEFPCMEPGAQLHETKGL